MKWLITAGVVSVVAAVSLAGQETRVLSNRLNLRARPLEGSEVVGQVNQGDLLVVLSAEGEWAEVQAPSHLGVWVKGEFLKDGRVNADKVNVRSGPGVSYRSVGFLCSGATVQVRDTRGDWVSIVPPDGITVWVRKEYLEMPGPPVPSPVQTNETDSLVSVAADGMPEQSTTHGPAALPEGVRLENLAPVLGQGAVIKRRGVVERVPMAIFRGVEYRLVDEVEGKKVKVAYVRGRDTEMAELLGQGVIVTGRGWWLSGERWPLLYPDSVARLHLE